MATIASVELVGHESVPVGQLAFTRRRLRVYSRDRFPGKIRDNFLIIRGTELTNQINSFAVTFDGVTYQAKLIDSVAFNTSTIYVWFAVFKKAGSLTERVAEDQGYVEILGVGAITITIVTSEEEIVSGAGSFTNTNG